MLLCAGRELWLLPLLWAAQWYGSGLVALPLPTPARFQTHPVSCNFGKGIFCGKVRLGLRHLFLLPAHLLLTGLSADHRAES